jgi:hypothetical protein
MFRNISMSRAVCREWSDPCRLTGCRYHLGPTGGDDPCALNRAEAGSMTNEQIAPLIGMSDENVRLIANEALEKITPQLRELGVFLQDEPPPPSNEPEPEPPLKSRIRKSNPNQGNLF